MDLLTKQTNHKSKTFPQPLSARSIFRNVLRFYRYRYHVIVLESNQYYRYSREGAWLFGQGAGVVGG